MVTNKKPYPVWKGFLLSDIWALLEHRVYFLLVVGRNVFAFHLQGWC